MKKYICILCAAMFAVSCSKDEELEKVDLNNVVVTGNLSDQITDENISKIKCLTINGTISGEDWNTLFEMATMGSLEYLDMTNAKIVGKADADWWNDDEIPEFEFSQSKTLKEVYLPTTLKTIGKEAFSECPNLAQVHFPEGLDSIAPRAFYKTGLSGEFNVPKQLRVVGKQAFGYTKFNKVIIHSDILAARDNTMYQLYGNSVFANCDELTEVIVKEGCTMLELGFTHCTSLTKVSLPSTLKQIGYLSGDTHNYIFMMCENLESITLPKDLWFIGYNAFSYTALKTIDIPDKVQYIWTYAFHDCELLKKVFLPSSLININQGAFEGCKLLENITIPEKVLEIGYSAFAGCASLQSISFEGNVSSIGKEAFFNCTSLKTVILPNGLESLGSSAFEGCSSLSKVITPNRLKEIESSTFKDCVELQDVTIGESIETIGSSCFLHCPKLTELIIPITVKNIENYAFSYTGLNDLTVMWPSPIVISTNIFDGVNLSKSILKVPLGTKELYKAMRGWQNFGTIEEL